jgi:threonine/homoserine/homoserine lactone efflux protein
MFRRNQPRRTSSTGCYALLLGRAGRHLSQKRVRLMSRLSGCFLIGGAFWLALKR